MDSPTRYCPTPGSQPQPSGSSQQALPLMHPHQSPPHGHPSHQHTGYYGHNHGHNYQPQQQPHSTYYQQHQHPPPPVSGYYPPPSQQQQNNHVPITTSSAPPVTHAYHPQSQQGAPEWQQSVSQHYYHPQQQPHPPPSSYPPPPHSPYGYVQTQQQQQQQPMGQHVQPPPPPPTAVHNNHNIQPQQGQHALMNLSRFVNQSPSASPSPISNHNPGQLINGNNLCNNAEEQQSPRPIASPSGSCTNGQMIPVRLQMGKGQARTKANMRKLAMLEQQNTTVQHSITIAESPIKKPVKPRSPKKRKGSLEPDIPIASPNVSTVSPENFPVISSSLMSSDKKKGRRPKSLDSSLPSQIKTTKRRSKKLSLVEPIPNGGEGPAKKTPKPRKKRETQLPAAATPGHMEVGKPIENTVPQGDLLKFNKSPRGRKKKSESFNIEPSQIPSSLVPIPNGSEGPVKKTPKPRKKRETQLPPAATSGPVVVGEPIEITVPQGDLLKGNKNPRGRKRKSESFNVEPSQITSSHVEPIPNESEVLVKKIQKPRKKRETQLPVAATFGLLEVDKPIENTVSQGELLKANKSPRGRKKKSESLNVEPSQISYPEKEYTLVIPERNDTPSNDLKIVHTIRTAKSEKKAKTVAQMQLQERKAILEEEVAKVLLELKAGKSGPPSSIKVFEESPLVIDDKPSVSPVSEAKGKRSIEVKEKNAISKRGKNSIIKRKLSVEAKEIPTSPKRKKSIEIVEPQLPIKRKRSTENKVLSPTTVKKRTLIEAVKEPVKIKKIRRKKVLKLPKPEPFQLTAKKTPIPTVFVKSIPLGNGKTKDSPEKEKRLGPSVKVIGGTVKFYRGSDEEDNETEPKLPREKVPVQFDDSVPWICVFCQLGPQVQRLGDLFGPYFVTQKPGRGKVPTKRETWMHEECAVWSHNILLIGSTLRGLDEAVYFADREKCNACGLIGATVGCLKRGCTKAVHVPCAKTNSWKLEMSTMNSFCPEHI